VVFHCIVFPAMLMAWNDGHTERYVLPENVPANEFLNLEGQKISGSRNWAVWGLDFLTRYDPDPLRYYLTAIMPESKDADWDWGDFVQHNNNELVATWGNLANRVLTFCYKHWQGQVPDPGELRPGDLALLAQIEAGFATVGDLIEAVKLRAALEECVSLATQVNQYLDVASPWSQIKTDKAEAAKSIYTALRAIDSLKTLFAPFLPFTSQRLHEFLGYDGKLAGDHVIREYAEEHSRHLALTYSAEGVVGRWEPSHLPPGQALRQPAPLFKKLDDSVALDERARLG
jgi:methionyl-tRNA synthetase